MALGRFYRGKSGGGWHVGAAGLEYAKTRIKRPDINDDYSGGCLLVPEGRGAKRGFRVFPGQMLLKTMAYLAARGKWSSRQRGGAGKLVLQDVEEHFAKYGVDFSTAADARPLLMKELQAMGLLAGSADAGSSVAVACPY